MKRATPTPNRFITYTPNWWVNGFVLFAFFFLLDGCVDETSLVGFKKEPRMEVKFKEFSIPAVTVQADSINSQNLRSTAVGDRWLGGVIDNSIDPNFGNIEASIFTKIQPGPKLYSIKRSDFNLTKATLNLVLDNYVYGDTLNSESVFTLHEITDPNFNIENEYFTNSSVSFDPTPIATGTYQFKYDSIKKFISLNSDNVSTNNRFDTLTFELPIDAGLAKNLFDTLSGKGIYVRKKKSDGVTDTLVYSTYRNDSTFLKSFKGLAVVPQGGNRVLGFISRVSSGTPSSRLTLYYSYLDLNDNTTKNTQYNCSFQDPNYYQDIPSFTKIEYDRTSTSLAGLLPENKYTNFNAPDNFCYVQAGTGLFTKLDFTAVMDTIDSYSKIAINSAELIISVESSTTRAHIKAPSGFYLRVVRDNYRLFKPPLIPAIGSGGGATLVADPIYGNNYYCTSNESYLDVVSDENTILNLESVKDDNGQYYRGFLTQFFEYQGRIPSIIPRINYMALVPATYFGKSLNGVSFKNDQVKLRIYYSVPK